MNGSYTHICITAAHWDSLPYAFREMQERLANNPQPLPSAEQLKDFDRKSLVEIYVGQTYPMECVLRIPMQ